MNTELPPILKTGDKDGKLVRPALKHLFMGLCFFMWIGLSTAMIDPPNKDIPIWKNFFWIYCFTAVFFYGVYLAYFMKKSPDNPVVQFLGIINPIYGMFLIPFIWPLLTFIAIRRKSNPEVINRAQPR